MMDRDFLHSFFTKQLSLWSDCASRYDDLSQAKQKTVCIDGRDYTLMFNPSRMRSATANVVGGKVDRPCFLCRSNRPDEQVDIEMNPPGSTHRYLLSVNPFPILTHHFTIINDGHEPQLMTDCRLRDMAYIANQMEGYLVFFNGACSGASAPDHFHFQAVPQELVPLTHWDPRQYLSIGVQQCDAEDVKIDFSRSDNVNILCWNTPQGLRWWIVNRRNHRPRQYYAEDDSRVLISPAALEFAGVVPFPRDEDFHKADAALLEDILDQCHDREPLVDVGICAGDTAVTANPDGTSTIDRVRIGIGFHWDQTRRLTFEGRMIKRLNAETGTEWIVNRLPVERYLLSVISSEMSATSSLQLLKAHAVISRSWLMKQIQAKAREAFGTANDGVAADAMTVTEDEIVRWYDAHSHLSFDVCADDHCQRYQGLSPKMNPVVRQAIEETRGEVLMYDGEICDARFSKCCGGMTEEYRYCWENINVPYLSAVADTRDDGTDYCNTADRKVLQQVLNDYDLTTRDFYSWHVEYSQQQLSDLIEQKLHLQLGTVTALNPLARGVSGRIYRLQVVGSRRTVVIGKELEIRKALSPTHLYSSAFDVATSADSATGGVIFRLDGRGWGHGVGLCQIGAAVMGDEGCDYRQILEHYYKNAQIEKIW